MRWYGIFSARFPLNMFKWTKTSSCNARWCKSKTSDLHPQLFFYSRYRLVYFSCIRLNIVYVNFDCKRSDMIRHYKRNMKRMSTLYNQKYYGYKSYYSRGAYSNKCDIQPLFPSAKMAPFSQKEDLVIVQPCCTLHIS